MMSSRNKVLNNALVNLYVVVRVVLYHHIGLTNVYRPENDAVMICFPMFWNIIYQFRVGSLHKEKDSMMWLTVCSGGHSLIVHA